MGSSSEMNPATLRELTGRGIAGRMPMLPTQWPSAALAGRRVPHGFQQAPKAAGANCAIARVLWVAGQA